MTTLVQIWKRLCPAKLYISLSSIPWTSFAIIIFARPVNTTTLLVTFHSGPELLAGFSCIMEAVSAHSSLRYGSVDQCSLGPLREKAGW